MFLGVEGSWWKLFWDLFGCFWWSGGCLEAFCELDGNTSKHKSHMIVIWIRKYLEKQPREFRRRIEEGGGGAAMSCTDHLFEVFSHNTCCLWASLTCSPEHTARQCRNLTFPAGSVKRHRWCCTPPFTTPQYIIACIGWTCSYTL